MQSARRDIALAGLPGLTHIIARTACGRLNAQDIAFQLTQISSEPLRVLAVRALLRALLVQIPRTSFHEALYFESLSATIEAWVRITAPSSETMKSRSYLGQDYAALNDLEWFDKEVDIWAAAHIVRSEPNGSGNDYSLAIDLAFGAVDDESRVEFTDALVNDLDQVRAQRSSRAIWHSPLWLEYSRRPAKEERKTFLEGEIDED
jgi:hypothetical protein